MNKGLREKNTRNGTADLLKGIAVILMIQVHLVELFARQEFFNSRLGEYLLFLGGPPAAPIFMAVMGYFVFTSKKSTGQFVVRGLRLIAGGLLLNIGLNLHLLILIFNGSSSANPYHYIFGSDILPLAGLSIIILALIKSRFRNNPYVFLTVGFLVLLLTPLLPDIYTSESSPAAFIQAFFWGDLKWSYFPLFPWLFYPVAGYITGIISSSVYNITANKIILYPVSAVILIIILLTWDYGLSVSSDLDMYYHHNILFAGWTVLFCTLYTGVIHYLHKRFFIVPLILYLKWVGKNVTAYYVFQWLLIGNVATALYKTQYGIQLVLWFSIVLIAVTMLVLLYNAYKEKLNFHTLKKA